MTKKVIYFINGPVPTVEQRNEAATLGAVFRNALAIGQTDYVEKCDAVAGCVPAAYRNIPMAKAADDKSGNKGKAKDEAKGRAPGKNKGKAKDEAQNEAQGEVQDEVQGEAKDETQNEVDGD